MSAGYPEEFKLPDDESVSTWSSEEMMTDHIEQSSTQSEVDLTNSGMSAEEEIVRNIYIIGLPIILCLGTGGNVLSFVIMLRKKMRSSSTSFYFAVLAISDTLYLFSYIPTEIVYSYSRYEIDISVFIR